MIKRWLIIVAVLGAGGAAADEPGGDPILTYSDTVQDIVAQFNEKLVASQPFLVWPGSDLDQDERDDIAWELEVIIGELRNLRYEMAALAVPQGFDEAHKLILGAFDLYMTALSRCGSGVQRDYVKTFNGGVQDYNAAGTYLDSGFGELESALRSAGYTVQ